MKKYTLILLAILFLSVPFRAAAQDDGSLGSGGLPKRKPAAAPKNPRTPATPGAPATPTTPATPSTPTGNTSSDPAVSSAPHEPFDTAPATKPFTPPPSPKGDPIPAAALNGTWIGTDPANTPYTLTLTDNHVSISGKHAWSGTYDPANGTLSLTFHPSPEDMDKNAPADAKANVAGKFTWYMTLTARHIPGKVASLQLEGQWFEGFIDWQPKPEDDPKNAGVKRLSWYSEGEPAKPITMRKIRSI